MKAVILAAGLGTRMKKAYPGIPKVLLPVNGKPLLSHHIIHLKKFGFKEFFINLHYLPNKIEKFLGDGRKFGVKRTYSFEPKLLGTAGALHNFKKNLDSTFVVLYGDIFTTLDFKKFLKFHKQKDSQATLLVHKTSHTHDSDLVEMDGDNRIIKFYTSPHKSPITTTNLSSAAIYILEPETLEYIPDKIPADFVEDMFPTLLDKGFRIYGYNSNEYSEDMGTPDRYKQVKNDVKKLKLC